MRLCDLLEDEKEALLYHEIVGRVNWGEILGPGSGFILYFPVTNEPLLADAAVLFDDTWELWNREDATCES